MSYLGMNFTERHLILENISYHIIFPIPLPSALRTLTSSNQWKKTYCKPWRIYGPVSKLYMQEAEEPGFLMSFSYQYRMGYCWLPKYTWPYWRFCFDDYCQLPVIGRQSKKQYHIGSKLVPARHEDLWSYLQACLPPCWRNSFVHLQ